MNLHTCGFCGTPHRNQALAAECPCLAPSYGLPHNGRTVSGWTQTANLAWQATARAKVRRQTRHMVAAVTVLWALIALVAASYLPGALSTVALLACAVVYVCRLVKVGRSHRTRMAQLGWYEGGLR